MAKKENPPTPVPQVAPAGLTAARLPTDAERLAIAEKSLEIMQAAVRARATDLDELREELKAAHLLQAKLTDETSALTTRAFAAERVRDAAQEGLVASQNAQLILQKTLDAVLAEQSKAAAEFKSLRAEQSRLREQLALAQAQLTEKKQVPFVTPVTLSKMTSAFLRGLAQEVPGFALREGELQLKVAVAATDDGQSGFVVPSAALSAKELPVLQALNLRFGTLEVPDAST